MLGKLIKPTKICNGKKYLLDPFDEIVPDDTLNMLSFIKVDLLGGNCDLLLQLDALLVLLQLFQVLFLELPLLLLH